MAESEGAATGGGAFYDLPGVLAAFTADRGAVSDPIATMEEPAISRALGDVTGRRIVDLGCGEARVGARLLAAGARSYVGVDSSERMLEAAARVLHGTAGTLVAGTIEDVPLPPACCDVVLARMALHYVADLAAALAGIRRLLEPGGRLVASVTHPVVTSHDARADASGPRGAWLVDRYFEAGPRHVPWLGQTVVWHHRTVAQHVAALTGAGFALTDLDECEPVASRFGDAGELARRRRIPLILVLGATAV